ncbi:MAG: hypothetical protein HQK55_08170, partial [Deltaproteobacteria bacterium]|nr:hypothetical protein [Deltaproteobacteria bacterium]
MNDEVKFTPAIYFSVALVSGAIIAYELFVMRVFANGGWAHFGSTVISIAMFGFGVFSTILCIWRPIFKARSGFWINLALIGLGPLMVAANIVAQQIPFNPIFLVSDPDQKYLLTLLFVIYFIPFLFGAGFLGMIFLTGQQDFGKVYFANMTGSGLGGLFIFITMYYLRPEQLFIIPVLIWALGLILWLIGKSQKKLIPVAIVVAILTLVGGQQFPQVNISAFKGVSYAKNFPDSQRVYDNAGPFGYLEVYLSSYFHFAPGLSDTASLHLKEMPEKAYLGMYIDGDGPIGIMKKLPPSQTEYIKFLPLSMPYLLKPQADVLVMQFGGGISTNVALNQGARQVTVAEGNPMVVEAMRDSSYISDFTGHILADPRVKLVPYDGRIFVAQTQGQYDIVDLSLADSTGLSMPGGSSIYEKYNYTKETLQSCLKALKKGGVLAITVWNKEDPPKSTLKLMRSLIEAGLESGTKDIKQDLFMAHTYLSTLTMLYKAGGFSAAEVQQIDDYCHQMSFGIIYEPGQAKPAGDLERIFQAYRDAYFAPEENENLGADVDMSADNLYRLVADRL